MLGPFPLSTYNLRLRIFFCSGGTKVLSESLVTIISDIVEYGDTNGSNGYLTELYSLLRRMLSVVVI